MLQSSTHMFSIYACILIIAKFYFNSWQKKIKTGCDMEQPLHETEETVTGWVFWWIIADFPYFYEPSFLIFPVDSAQCNNNNVCFIVLSLSVPLQWPVPGVFPVRAHRARAAEPQPDHDERWEEEIKDVTNICDILILLNVSIQSKLLLS